MQHELPESTKPTTKPLTIPSMEASSLHAGGERRCFGRVSKDVTQERGLAIKVAPLTSAGVPRRRRGSTVRAALAETRRAKERTYIEFADAQPVLKPVVAGVPKLPPSSACSHGRGRAVPP